MKILFAIFLISYTQICFSQLDRKRLIDKLITNYDARCRPVQTIKNVTNVTFSVDFMAFIDAVCVCVSVCVSVSVCMCVLKLFQNEAEEWIFVRLFNDRVRVRKINFLLFNNF
jgi:hypothetical protein